MAKCETCGKPLEYRGMGKAAEALRRWDCYAVARRWRRRRVPRYIYRVAVLDGRCQI